jgi:Ulp1 family protease
LDARAWAAEHPSDIPHQANGCDCGVFTLLYADYRGAGRPFDANFSQANMNRLRMTVLARLLNQRVE